MGKVSVCLLYLSLKVVPLSRGFGTYRLRKIYNQKFCGRVLFTSMNNSGMLLPGVYHSLDSIFNTLKCTEYEALSEVKELISIYENEKAKEKDLPPNGKRKPFIVLEGMDGCGKSTLTRKLAKKIGGKAVSTPPTCLLPLRDAFDQHEPELRKAYYALGNYIAALQVRQTTIECPVVMDRFWHSTAAYAISHVLNIGGEMKVHAEVYEWPHDLMRPDLVVYLDVTESNRLKRLSSRKVFTDEENFLEKSPTLRNHLFAAYKSMKNPGITLIDANGSIKEVLCAIQNLGLQK